MKKYSFINFIKKTARHCRTPGRFVLSRTAGTFLLILIAKFSSAQSSNPSFKKLSRPEKWWVVTHLFVAKKAARITIQARTVSKGMLNDSLLDHDADGGQVDAFRHSYWMARLAQEMCWRKAVKLGNAHEKGNYLDFKKKKTGEEVFSDSIASAMDLFNNKKGIETGRENKSVTKEEIQKLILAEILSGKMKIILKDSQGNSLDCDHQSIDLKKYSRVWNVPRCLINSDKK